MEKENANIFQSNLKDMFKLKYYEYIISINNLDKFQ